jgi:hypothetical protein
MDDETREGFAEMRRGFARMERWFELGQQQHLEFRAEVEQRFTSLEGRMSGLEGRMSGMERALGQLRDWVTGAIADLRSTVQQILTRLDRLERRQGDPFG